MMPKPSIMENNMRHTVQALVGTMAIILVAVLVMATNRQFVLVAADQKWLWSDQCQLGTDPDSCALELANKRQLRQGPIDVGPAPNPDL